MLLLICLFYALLRTYSNQTLILVFIIISCISFFNGWFSPLKSAIIGEIISPDRRVKANGLLSTVDQTFQFVGWSLGGLIIAFLGEGYTIILTIFCCLHLFFLFYFVYHMATLILSYVKKILPIRV